MHRMLASHVGAARSWGTLCTGRSLARRGEAFRAHTMIQDMPHQQASQPPQHPGNASPSATRPPPPNPFPSAILPSSRLATAAGAQRPPSTNFRGTGSFTLCERSPQRMARPPLTIERIFDIMSSTSVPIAPLLITPILVGAIPIGPILIGTILIGPIPIGAMPVPRKKSDPTEKQSPEPRAIASY
jgi:hypothetical protein